MGYRVAVYSVLFEVRLTSQVDLTLEEMRRRRKVNLDF